MRQKEYCQTNGEKQMELYKGKSYQYYYEEVRKHRFKTITHYVKTASNFGFPPKPKRHFPSSFKNMGDFTGLDKLELWNGMTYDECRQKAIEFRFKNSTEYKKKYFKVGLPSNPKKSFPSDFINMKLFISTNDIELYNKKTYLQCSLEAKNILFETPTDYHNRAISFNLPQDPKKSFPSNFKSYTKYLGNHIRTVNKLMPYEKAKALTLKQNFKSVVAYNNRNKSLNLPNNPAYIYGKKFEGWLIFGNIVARVKNKVLSYAEARLIAISLGCKNTTEYKAVAVKNGLPYKPRNTYKNDWISWFDFAGFHTEEKTETVGWNKSLSKLIGYDWSKIRRLMDFEKI